MNEHINQRRAEIAKNIAGSYNSIQKSESSKEEQESKEYQKLEDEKVVSDGDGDNEDKDIEKGGEGSRGGKIIGHTSTGKPIYQKNDSKFTQDHYSKFSEKEHREAAQIHKDNGNDKAHEAHSKRADQMKQAAKNYDPSEDEEYEGFGEKKKKGESKYNTGGEEVKKSELNEHIQLNKANIQNNILNSYSLLNKSEAELVDYFEKGKRAQIGEVRTHAGEQYIKTANGWKFVGKYKGKGREVHDGLHGSNPDNLSHAALKHKQAMDEGATEVEADQIARGKRNVGDHSGKDEDKEAIIAERHKTLDKVTNPKTGKTYGEEKEPLITQAMIEKVKEKNPKSDKEILGVMRIYAQEVGNTYTESEYSKMLDEYKASNKEGIDTTKLFDSNNKEKQSTSVNTEITPELAESMNKVAKQEKYSPKEAYDKLGAKGRESLLGQAVREYMSAKELSWDIHNNKGYRLPKNIQDNIQPYLDKLEVHPISTPRPTANLPEELRGGVFIGSLNGEHYLIDTQGYDYARYVTKLDN